MGRALLVLAALALFGCRDPKEKPVASHDDLACAACHRGNRADVGRASVPREACTASGCHEDAGPPEVTLATARFEHRNHGVRSDIALNCAGCHTHDRGEAPLTASLDACALCHKQDVAGSKGNECRLCHRQLTHESMTSQGIPVAHGSLPWVETGCSRCHYDVLATQKKVTVETCTKCHARTSDVTSLGIARDLHPSHRGVNCTSCHERGLHRIGAMSSAVNLQCADCHTQEHDQPVVASSTASCEKCHADAHRAEQRMVLGFVGNEPVLPSAKFMLGMTCRSCHVPPGSTAQAVTARRGSAAACTACHEPEYAKVLSWWKQGVRERGNAVEAYVGNARRALRAAPDTARSLIARSDTLLALVRKGGGHHNLELSDRIFRTSLAQTENAYRLAGRAAPPVPALGNTPHMGMCSFCHYAGAENLNYGAMNAELHERLIRTRR